MGDCVSDTQTVLFNFVRFRVSIRDGAFIVQVARESLIDTHRKTAINILYTRAAYLPTAGCLQSLCVACKPSLPALAHSLTPLWYPNLATSIGGE